MPDVTQRAAGSWLALKRRTRIHVPRHSQTSTRRSRSHIVNRKIERTRRSVRDLYSTKDLLGPVTRSNGGGRMTRLVMTGLIGLLVAGDAAASVLGPTVHLPFEFSWRQYGANQFIGIPDYARATLSVASNGTEFIVGWAQYESPAMAGPDGPFRSYLSRPVCGSVQCKRSAARRLGYCDFLRPLASGRVQQ